MTNAPSNMFSLVPPRGWLQLTRTNQGIPVRRVPEFISVKAGIKSERTVTGSIVSGSADTERQSLLALTRFQLFKLDLNGIIIEGQQLRDDPDYDYYALDGRFEHSVLNSQLISGEVGPKRNFTALGYFADRMNLSLEFYGDDAAIFEFAPTSTVGSSIESFTIGLSISVGFKPENKEGSIVSGMSGSIALNLAWQRSYTAPAVSITPSRNVNRIEFLARLPGSEYAFDGTSTPKPPAISYSFDPQVIVRVKKNSGLLAVVKGNVDWKYIWPASRYHDEQTGVIDGSIGINCFYIRNVASGRVLDVEAWGGRGSRVISSGRKSGADARNQLWYLTPNGGIRSLANNLALAVAEDNPSNNRLIVWDPQDSVGQRWMLTRQQRRDEQQHDSRWTIGTSGNVYISELKNNNIVFAQDEPQFTSSKWILELPEGGGL